MRVGLLVVGGGQHVASRVPGLLDGVAPVLHGDQAAAIDRIRPARDVARRVDVLARRAVRRERPAGAVAGEPARIRHEARTGEPSRAAHGAERHDGDLGLDRLAAAQMGPPKPAEGITLQKLDMRAGAKIDARPLQETRDDTAHEGAEGPRQRRRIGVDQGHVDAEVPAAGGGLAADQPAPDDQDVARPLRQHGAQGRRIVAPAQGEHAAERRPLGAGPGPGLRARRDQEAPIGERAPVGEAERAGLPVEAGGGHAEMPVGPQRHEVGQGGGVGGELPRQHVLRQGRPVIGRVRLVSDDVERARVAAKAQGLGPAQARERCADDDDAGLRQRAHDPVSTSGLVTASSPSTLIARTGQA
ncbi:hypothetical protein AEGHOMDF_5224 [Methylobacterium soli]|nr:hypothetical protein AEGHOMDF_5224 [Methylobacterium soli]